MELPTYHLPQPKALMIHLWDKLKGYVKKAFTIILASTIVIWFLQSFTFDWKYIEQANPNDIADEVFEEYKEDNADKILLINEEYVSDGEVTVDLATLVTDYAENEDEELDPLYKDVIEDVFTLALESYKEVVGDSSYHDSSDSILAGLGKLITPLFTPLGFGSQLNENGWIFGVSAITGLIAKENVVATFTVLAQSVQTNSIVDVDSYMNLYKLALDEEGVSATIAAATASGITGKGFMGYSILIAFIVFNMTTIPCFAAVATAKGEVGKKKFKTTILFWLCTSYIASSIVYLVLAKWWLSFVFLAAFTVLGFCIYFINKKRDLKEAGVIK
jgi:Fe2+ transport system protein B